VLKITEPLRIASTRRIQDMLNCGFTIIEFFVYIDDTVIGLDDDNAKFVITFHNFLRGTEKYRINSVGEDKKLYD
jgi:hypothetical protein